MSRPRNPSPIFGAHMTQGALLLDRYIGDRKLLDVAAEFHINETYLGKLRRGERRPSFELADQFEIRLHIPMKMWARPVHKIDSSLVGSKETERIAQ